MNIFVNWINEDNGEYARLFRVLSVCLSVEPEIATPPLSGTILPGVTRKSLLELGAQWVS